MKKTLAKILSMVLLCSVAVLASCGSDEPENKDEMTRALLSTTIAVNQEFQKICTITATYFDETGTMQTLEMNSGTSDITYNTNTGSTVTEKLCAIAVHRFFTQFPAEMEINLSFKLKDNVTASAVPAEIKIVTIGEATGINYKGDIVAMGAKPSVLTSKDVSFEKLPEYVESLRKDFPNVKISIDANGQIK